MGRASVASIFRRIFRPTRNVCVLVGRRALHTRVVAVVTHIVILTLSITAGGTCRLVCNITSRLDDSKSKNIARAKLIRRQLPHVSFVRQRRHLKTLGVPPMITARAATRTTDEFNATDWPRNVRVENSLGDPARKDSKSDGPRVSPERLIHTSDDADVQSTRIRRTDPSQCATERHYQRAERRARPRFTSAEPLPSRAREQRLTLIHVARLEQPRAR